MSSIRPATRADGTVCYRIFFREWDEAKGRRIQSCLTFDDYRHALKWQKILDQVGPEQVRKMLLAEDEESNKKSNVPTLNTFAPTYIDGLTGVEQAWKNRCRAYLRNDIGPYMGDLPLPALCSADAERNSIVQDWVSDMEADGVAGKTIANKHGFLSACLKVAVRRRLLPFNPCDDSKLPPRHYEPCFLEPEEFDLLHDMSTVRWRPSLRFLVISCLRFSEYTALPKSAIKPDKDNPGDYLARVARAWKYTGTSEKRLGNPKTRRGIRTINIAGEAVEDFDLNGPGLLVTNADGERLTSQRFHNSCWRPLMEEFEEVTGKRPRPQDLRHTGASWMLNNGAEITDVQKHLGHESIQTTVDIYGHLDRRSGRRASTAMSKALVRTTIKKR